MPYTVSINAVIDGTAHDDQEARHLLDRLQSALQVLQDKGYDVVEYEIEVEDEALDVKVGATNA